MRVIMSFILSWFINSCRRTTELFPIHLRYIQCIMSIFYMYILEIECDQWHFTTWKIIHNKLFVFMVFSKFQVKSDLVFIEWTKGKSFFSWGNLISNFKISWGKIARLSFYQWMIKSYLPPPPPILWKE